MKQTIAEEYRKRIAEYTVIKKVKGDTVQVSVPVFRTVKGICQIRYDIIINQKEHYAAKAFIDLKPEQAENTKNTVFLAMKYLQQTLQKNFPKYGSYWQNAFWSEMKTVLTKRHRILKEEPEPHFFD